MKQSNQLAKLLIVTIIALVLSSCGVCDVENTYTWNDQIGSTPPQAMLDELTTIVNNEVCNPHLSENCNPNSVNFSERVLGSSPAEAIQDNYGGQYNGSNGSEDFTLDHKVVTSRSTPTNFSIAELNLIKDKAINKAKESAPYCSCQSYRAKIVDIEVKSWEQSYPPSLNNEWRRSLYITVKYQCCGQCA